MGWSQCLPTPPWTASQTLPCPGPLGSQNNCCPTSWLEHEGKCYWVSSSGKPWPEAEKYCQLEDAYLVVINSREEQVRPLERRSKTRPIEENGSQPWLHIGITWGAFNNDCHLNQTLRGLIGPGRWDKHPESPRRV